MTPTDVKQAVLHYMVWLLVLGGIAIGLRRAQGTDVELARPRYAPGTTISSTYIVDTEESKAPTYALSRVYPGGPVSAAWGNSLVTAIGDLEGRIRAVEDACSTGNGAQRPQRK